MPNALLIAIVYASVCANHVHWLNVSRAYMLLGEDRDTLIQNGFPRSARSKVYLLRCENCEFELGSGHLPFRLLRLPAFKVKVFLVKFLIPIFATLSAFLTEMRKERSAECAPYRVRISF